MVSDKSLWGNELRAGNLQRDAKNSNFKIFENSLYMKSGSMHLKGVQRAKIRKNI